MFEQIQEPTGKKAYRLFRRHHRGPPAARAPFLHLPGQTGHGAECLHRFGNDHACNQNPLGLEKEPMVLGDYCSDVVASCPLVYCRSMAAGMDSRCWIAANRSGRLPDHIGSCSTRREIHRQRLGVEPVKASGGVEAKPTSPWRANSWESSTTPSRTTGCSRTSPTSFWPPNGGQTNQ